MKATVFLLMGLFFVGCSSVREDPDDSFAPRPENAKSASYMIVRLGEEETFSGIRKHQLLDIIKNYREKYAIIKAQSDFGTGHYDDIRYREYSQKVQAFKDSDLDAAEKYIKTFPDSLKFSSGDNTRVDLSDKLRIVDFYGQYYTDDWSAYAFIINMIPTARNGYVKLELDINGEKLAFRKKARKKIWRFSPEYFWMYVDFYFFENSQAHAPALLSISDPNDHGDMNGIYLIMPQAGVADTSAIVDMRKAEEKAKLDPNYIPPPKLDYGRYLSINKDNIDGAEYVYEKRNGGAEDMEVYRYLSANSKTIGKDMNVRSVLDAYRYNQEKYRQRMEEVRKTVPKLKANAIVKTSQNPSAEAGPWSIINEENFPIADIVYGEMSRKRTAEQTLETFRKGFKWAKDEELILKFTELYKLDSKKYKSLLLPFRKK